ncbi:MAG TPA: hypothetical protein VK789_18455 [Bryobacteraceae bacterium]|jgi:hypothetical protein|nr:hypothetical protein [Bryobacteraceae bacterium]
MKPLNFVVCAALCAIVLSAAPAKRKLTGVITDAMCANADHSHMKMGPTDAACTMACVMEHGAEFVLYDGKEAWTLSDQKTPEKFAGMKVTVTGAPDAKTHKIQVDSISAAK